jgi:hypothetical protein
VGSYNGICKLETTSAICLCTTSTERCSDWASFKNYFIHALILSLHCYFGNFITMHCVEKMFQNSVFDNSLMSEDLKVGKIVKIYLKLIEI